jgi:hypothetical protein
MNKLIVFFVGLAMSGAVNAAAMDIVREERIAASLGRQESRLMDPAIRLRAATIVSRTARRASFTRAIQASLNPEPRTGSRNSYDSDMENCASDSDVEIKQ